MPGSAGRWPASLCGGINAVAGQRSALPFGSFPEEPRQGVHRLFQPLQMQLVFAQRPKRWADAR